MMNYPMTLSSHIEGIYPYLKRNYKKEGDRLFSRVCCDRTRGNSLKEGRFSLGIRQLFYNKGGEALERVAQRCGGYPIPGDFQGETGLSPGQPDLAVHVPVHCRGVGLDDL